MCATNWKCEDWLPRSFGHMADAPSRKTGERSLGSQLCCPGTNIRRVPFNLPRDCYQIEMSALAEEIPDGWWIEVQAAQIGAYFYVP